MKKLILVLFILIPLNLYGYERTIFLSNQYHSNLKFSKDYFFETVNVGSDLNNGTSPLTPKLTFENAKDLLTMSGYDTLIIIHSDTPYILNSQTDMGGNKVILSNNAVITSPISEVLKYFRNFYKLEGLEINSVYSSSAIDGYIIDSLTYLKNCVIKNCYSRRTDGAGGASAVLSVESIENCLFHNNIITHSATGAGRFLVTTSPLFSIKNSLFLNNNCKTSLIYNANNGIVFDSCIIQDNKYSVFSDIAYTFVGKNLVFGNSNLTNYTGDSIVENINFTKIGNDTYYQFNTNRVEYGLNDTGIVDIFLYSGNYSNDTLTYLFLSSKLSNKIQKEVISGYVSFLNNSVYTIDTLALFLNNPLLPQDTIIFILTSDTVNGFNYDTQRLVLESSNFPADIVNNLLYLYHYPDSYYIIPRLLYNAPMTVNRFDAIETSAINIKFQWDNIKGANAIVFELSDNALFTPPRIVDIILPMNTKEYSNLFLSNGTFYWRIKGLKQ